MAIAVLALTIVAFSIRVGGLWGWDGTLTVDEARLALAARGVLATGLPQMPSGWMYTRGLLASNAHGASKGRRLETIPGSPPILDAAPKACGFAVRCAVAEQRCSLQPPPVVAFADGRMARCIRAPG